MAHDYSLKRAGHIPCPVVCCNVALYDMRRCRALSSMRLSLHLAADGLDLLENAQNVATENLLDVLSAVAPVEQRLRDFRQIGGGIDAGGSCSGDAIEVRADAYMVYPRNLGDVIDVV